MKQSGSERNAVNQPRGATIKEGDARADEIIKNQTIKKQKAKNKEKKSNATILTEIGAAFLLAAACIVLETLCITFFTAGKIARNQSLFLWLSAGTTMVSFVAAAAFSCFCKNVAYRFTVSVYVLLIFMLTVLYILQKTGMFYVINSEELFRDYMQRAGALMPLLFIAFQFLQVVALPVPAFVSTAAGVALFGPFKAALCSFVGIITGSLLAFFIGRKIGYKAVAWMVGKDDLDKWLKKVKGKDNFLLTAMFVLPLFPDDMLCFISGLSSMSWQYFVLMIIFARALGITATCYSVNFIPFNTWWGIVVWCALIVLIVVSFAAMYKNLDAINEFFMRRFKVFRNTGRKTKRENVCRAQKTSGAYALSPQSLQQPKEKRPPETIRLRQRKSGTDAK
ncbi:MAG: TVP38/TMEM64 family protein [Candidatus Borkfalkiaceae bacterium]|nr:TVP38/TMEM64 family protein [Clostridia bacterium]MDY6223726.1 TVP38/TMEM64 family protein [Christensenellaceae bacterium]